MALPFGAMAGLQVGGAALRALPSLLPDEAERANKRRLRELQAIEEAGALGLTPQQRQLFVQQRSGAIDQQLDEAARQQRRTAAGGAAMGAGDVQAQALAQGAEARQQATQTQTDLLRADLQQEQLQRQEIEDRLAQAAARTSARRESASDVAGGAVDIVEQGLETRNLLGMDRTAPTPERTQKIESFIQSHSNSFQPDTIKMFDDWSRSPANRTQIDRILQLMDTKPARAVSIIKSLFPGE